MAGIIEVDDDKIHRVDSKGMTFWRARSEVRANIDMDEATKVNGVSVCTDSFEPLVGGWQAVKTALEVKQDFGILTYRKRDGRECNWHYGNLLVVQNDHGMFFFHLHAKTISHDNSLKRHVLEFSFIFSEPSFLNDRKKEWLRNGRIKTTLSKVLKLAKDAQDVALDRSCYNCSVFSYQFCKQLGVKTFDTAQISLVPVVGLIARLVNGWTSSFPKAIGV